MATSESNICKNIERELKALIMPSDGQGTSTNNGTQRYQHHPQPRFPAEASPSYENDFPLLGSDYQWSHRGWAKHRRGQGRGQINQDERKGFDNSRKRRHRARDKNKKQGDFYDDRGNILPKCHQDMDNDVRLLSNNRPVQNFLKDKVVIDLHQNPVSCPLYMHQITDKPAISKKSAQGEASCLVNLDEQKIVDVTAVDNTLHPRVRNNEISKKRQPNKGKSKLANENVDKNGSEVNALRGRRTEEMGKSNRRFESTGNRKPMNSERHDGPGLRDLPFSDNSRPKMQYQANREEDHRMHDMKDPRKLAKLKNLEDEYIFYLKKPSHRYPGAQLFCQLCGYHCNFENVERHSSAQHHKSAVQARRAEVLLKCLPFPSELQIEAVTELVSAVAEEFGLSSDDMMIRQDLISRLNQLVSLRIPGCRLKLFGSSVTGFGLKDSDVNIDVVLQPGSMPATVLTELYQIFKEHDDIVDAESDFEDKFPRILLVDKKTSLSCCVGWNNVQATQTANLLAAYASLDGRVKILGTAFRYWAKLCGIDRQEKGMLPAHAFSLLVVYFLQQRKPAVLPVLHELQQSNDSEKYLDPSDVGKMWKSCSEESVGELWLDLLRFYSVDFRVSEFVVCLRKKKPVLRSEKNWTGKIMAIEDPYCRKRNLTRSISSKFVYSYIQECFRETYRYFGVPQLKSGPLFVTLPKELLNASGKYRLGQEDRPPVTEDEDDHKAESDSIDAATLRVSESNDADCSDDDEDVIEESNSDQEQKRAYSLHNDFGLEANGFEDQDPDLNTDEVVSRLAGMGLSALRRKKNDRTDSESSEAFDVAEEKKNIIEVLGTSVQVVEVKKLMSGVASEELYYTFDMDVFTSGKLPPVFCSLCSKEGHLKMNCPDEVLPELIPLPAMSKEFMYQLDQICENIMIQNVPSENELRYRKDLLRKLEAIVKETYPDAKLDLYGSSCNGFGFTGSDLDVCVTLENKPSEGLDFSKMIETLAASFEKQKDFANINAIPTAKVPIVKVTDRKSNIECDISFYNTLAQHNTRMLRAYSEIDKRAQVLGYTMKHFAKLCEIGDASRGSLSSYAFILMVFHFLQQRNPPVLPVLQELYDHRDEQPQVIVEGWNAWFYEDIENLDSVWPERGKNTESVGELWLGLLRFYTEEFDWKRNVVCSRRKSILTCFEKMWRSKSFAIEDPLDLNHNLGSGVSNKMHTFIMKTLINGRRTFGTPVCDFQISKGLQQYLFNPNKLKDGQPPNDRGCRLCGKIRHKVKDCPLKKKKRGGENREQMQRANWQQNQRPRERLRSLPPPPPRGDAAVKRYLNQLQPHTGYPCDNPTMRHPVPPVLYGHVQNFCRPVAPPPFANTRKWI